MSVSSQELSINVDLSGIWAASDGKYLQNLAADGVEVPMQPWAAALYKERSTNLAVLSAFTSIATNIPGQPGTTTYTDTNATAAGPRFYRVGVSNP